MGAVVHPTRWQEDEEPVRELGKVMYDAGGLVHGELEVLISDQTVKQQDALC